MLCLRSEAANVRILFKQHHVVSVYLLCLRCVMNLYMVHLVNALYL